MENVKRSGSASSHASTAAAAPHVGHTRLGSDLIAIAATVLQQEVVRVTLLTILIQTNPKPRPAKAAATVKPSSGGR